MTTFEAFLCVGLAVLGFLMISIWIRLRELHHMLGIATRSSAYLNADIGMINSKADAEKYLLACWLDGAEWTSAHGKQFDTNPFIVSFEGEAMELFELAKSTRVVREG